VKQSRRNIRNANAKAERLAEGKPKLSKYARKARAAYVEAELAQRAAFNAGIRITAPKNEDV